MSESTEIKQYPEWTAGAVTDHLDKAAGQGYVNPSTASAMATAVRKILQALHRGDWDQQDLKDVDQADLFRRFETLADFKVETMHTYEKRFTKALESYDLWKRDKKAWAQEMNSQPRRRRASKAEMPSGNGESTGPSDGGVRTSPPAASADDQPPRTPAADLVSYHFPLRPGVFAQLRLPSDLRKVDVQRLSAFLATLPLEPLPELTAGLAEGES